MSREAMQMALEALEDYVEEYGPHEKDSGAAYAITSLRQALETEKQWVGLTKEDMPDGDNPMFDTNEFYAGMSAWHGWLLREVLFDNGEPIGHREPEQEPVAWRYKYPDGVWRFSNGERVNGSDSIKSQALYTAPPKRDLTCVCGAVWDGEMMVHPPKKREWVGLHGSEVPDTYKYDVMFMEGWLWAEERLKEKNHG